MAYKQKNNPFPVTSCGRRRTFMNGGNPGNDRTKDNPFTKRADKDSMPCNKPRESTKSNPSGMSTTSVLSLPSDRVVTPPGPALTAPTFALPNVPDPVKVRVSLPTVPVIVDKSDDEAVDDES